METLAATIVGILVSLLQEVANRFFYIDEPKDKATLTVLLNFVATTIIVALFYQAGTDLSLEYSITLFGVTFGANQLFHLLKKYIPQYL